MKVPEAPHDEVTAPAIGDTPQPQHILVLGGGFVGLYTCLGLEKKLSVDEARITLINPESFMAYQPFLPEAASGNIEPRHVVVPLRTVLGRTHLITGSVTGADHVRHVATISPPEGEPYEIGYDTLVVALGSVSRVLPVQGLAETAVGFKTLAEAIFLRNQVLECMDAAESAENENLRARLLTFVFVGGGYAGVEALAELEDLARDASSRYRHISRADMRWILVEAASEILPEMAPDMGPYAVRILSDRGIEVRLNTTLVSAEGGHMQLSNGEEFEAHTLVWTTGVKPHPLVARLGFPTDERGRLVVDPFLRVQNAVGVWAGGDCAAVPDLAMGGTNPPTAQHALRHARRIASNIAASQRGEPLKEFRYRNMGGLASLGRYKGIARVFGIRLKGFPAWWLHRNYHLLMIPTFNRKVRIILDWTVGLFFRRDIAQLGSLQNPRQAFEEAAGKDTPWTDDQ
ncbi:MAG: NAD(P)/FAD-dependent oxidoreductase [Actinomycetota bacterium]|nr:NAD(P)/FAD-dependent oxidoreductase [Actinomycetota bacterium]